MRKILLFTFLTAAGLLTATGAPLSPEESLKRLETQENLMRLTGNYHPTLIYTQQEERNEATLYIFNKGNNNGFMIVSADDCTAPLLGYTDQGIFNDAEIPEALKYWIEEYSRQIAYMREAGLESTYRASSYKSYIAPLLSTAWGQTAPYNNYCYLTTTSGQTIECPTGCVATAMAQVMKYFEYPERGEGSISYTLFSNVPPLEMDFSEKPFEWSKMLDRYSGSYTAEEADAVAYLMKACGYSVKMSYNTDLSGAKSIDIAPAMIEYFKYSEATRYVKRAYYNADEWSDIIYNHLKGTGPVIYNGSSLTGGHSFVCDGYDGYGYFHINWGWDGMSNGYFLLDALEPSAQGTGGYAGGYNLNQDAVLAVPTSSEAASAQVYQYGSLVASVRSTTSLYFELTSDSYRGWTYYGSGNNVFDFGLTVEDLEGTEDTQYCATNGKNVSLSNSQITYSPLTATISDLNLTEGKSYRMTLSTKQNGIENAEWIKVRAENGLYDYVIVTPTAEGLVISDNHIGNLVAESVEALSEIYLSSPVKFKAELSNPTQEQLTRNISTIFTDNDGNIIYRTGNICFTVSAGKSVVKEWSSDQWFGSAQVTEPTEYTLSLFDNDRNTFIEGASAIVTVNPVAEQPDYTMTISLPDAIMENSTYILPTKNASVNLKINVQQGYYNGNVNLYVLSPISSSQYQTVYSQNLNEFVELKEGESGNYVIDLSFEGADPEIRYMILAGDQYGLDTKKCNQLFAKFDSSLNAPDVPALPGWSATPEPGRIDDIATCEFNIEWEGYELWLNEPELITVTENGEIIEGVEMRITTIYSEESEPSYALTIKLPMERLNYESIYIITIPENSVSIIVDNHALTNREIVLEYVTPQRPIPDMPAWSANPAPGSLDSIDFNTFYVDWENNEIELINPELITVTENDMIIEGVMVTVAQTSEENGKTTALAITLPIESLNYESSYMISIPEKSVNIIVDGYPLSNEEIILVYVTPANPIPDLPEWTATPEPGILTSIDFNTFNINWGEHNLELLDPGLVSVTANGTEIEGLSISLAPYRTEGNITYENGLLRIELPTETLNYETEYEVTIAANTVNVIIDGIAVGNEEIVLHYTTPEDSGVYSLHADKDGLYKVYSLSGSVIMVTADIHRLSTLNSGMYIINGKKIYIGLR